MKTLWTTKTGGALLSMSLFGLSLVVANADQMHDSLPAAGGSMRLPMSMESAGLPGVVAAPKTKAHSSFPLAGDQLKTHLLYAPGSTSDLIASMFSVAPSATAHLLPVAGTLIASSADAVNQPNAMSAGTQPKTAAAQLTPTKQMLATVNYTQATPATLGVPAATQIATGLTLNPSKALQVQTQWAENTGTSANQSASISVSAKPTSTSQLNASYATTNASAASTQVINLAAKVAPTKTLAVDAGADETRQSGDATGEQHVTVSLTPQKEVQLHTAVTLSETNQTSTTAVNVGAAIQPSSHVQVAADYTDRSAQTADASAPAGDALDTSTANISFLPTKGVCLTGNYAQNPDAGNGSQQRLEKHGVGLETSMGAFSLNGGYDWSHLSDDGSNGTSLHMGVGLRLSSALQLTGGYQETLSGIGLTPAGTSQYTFGLTHNLGDHFSFSMNGTMQQQTCQTSATPAAYTATANLGMKF